MNIHEECLINYLQKPDELSHTTDVLRLNNAKVVDIISYCLPLEEVYERNLICIKKL